MSIQRTPRLDASRIVNQTVNVDLIDAHPDNYNQHPDAQLTQLASSHQQFGQYRSVVLWQRPNGRYIQVAGHGYLHAAKSEGLPQVRADVLPEETAPETIKAIMIADNEHAKHSEPDEEVLARLLQEQVNAGYDLVSVGSDEDALHDMLAKMTPPTLDELTEQYGDEPEEDAFWPVIKVKVSPETKEVYDSLMEQAEGHDEGEKLAWLLERVNVALEGENE